MLKTGFRIYCLGWRDQGTGFKVEGTRLRFEGSGYRVQDSWFMVHGSGSRVWGLGFGFQGLPPPTPPVGNEKTASKAWLAASNLYTLDGTTKTCRTLVPGLGFRVQGLEFRVEGAGFRGLRV